MGMPLGSAVAAYWFYLSDSPIVQIPKVRPLLAIVLMLAVTFVTIRSIFRDRYRRGMLLRINDGKCPRCGYDLRESGGRCPECGDAHLQLSDEQGLTPGGDSHVFRNALLLIFSYCLSLMLLVNPSFIGSINQFAGHLYEDAVYAFQSDEFDSNDWKNAKVHHSGRTVRAKMVGNLIEGETWLGKTPEELVKILGRPDLSPEKYSGNYAYYLDQKHWGFGTILWSDDRYVMFELVDGTFRFARIQSDPQPTR